MSLFEKFAFLYDDAEFNAVERAEIGAFAMDLLKHASSGDQTSITNLVNQHFAYADEETLEKIAKYIQYFTKYEVEESEKTASIGTILGGVAAGLAAIPVISQAVRSIRTSMSLKDSLRKILAEHPELRNDPNTARYFEVLTTFSPSIAANPLVAGNIMKRWHETGPAFITPAAIKELLSAEETRAKLPATFQSGIKGFSDIVGKIPTRGVRT